MLRSHWIVLNDVHVARGAPVVYFVWSVAQLNSFMLFSCVHFKLKIFIYVARHMLTLKGDFGERLTKAELLMSVPQVRIATSPQFTRLVSPDNTS